MNEHLMRTIVRLVWYVDSLESEREFLLGDFRDHSGLREPPVNGK